MLKMIKSLVCAGVLLTGCTTYEPATIKDGIITNPAVGWNGYAIKVPDGVKNLRPSADENVPDREAEIRERYRDANERYVADYYTSFYEQFLFENPAQTYFISFISETYELPNGWNSYTSVEKQYMIQKLINRKKVIINDTQAHSEQVEFNGQRGWYISGDSSPYFRKGAQPVAYEGIFLIGGLKEVFWIEAFGMPGTRGEMKTKVYEMAESLKVN